MNTNIYIPEKLELVGKIHPLISNRRSTIVFSDEPVSEAKLSRLFEAARWAPSSYNEQPWRFIVATKDHHPNAYKKLLATIKPANKQWAQHAPVLIGVLAKRTLTANGKVNAYAWHDTGAAVANMGLQALHEGILMRQMGGFDKGQFRTAWEIGEDFDPVTVIAAGFPGNSEDLSPSMLAKENRPRVRKDLSEIVFPGLWPEQIDHESSSN